MGRRSSTCKFPVARIKKIMQADEDVGKVAQATPVAVSKALELFMQSLVESTLSEARSSGSRKLTAYHLKRAVHANETFDFLKDIVDKVPEPAGAAALPSSSGAGGAANAQGKKEENPWGATAASIAGNGYNKREEEEEEGKEEQDKKRRRR